MDVLKTDGIKETLDPGQPSPENYFYIFKSLYEGHLNSRYWEGIKDISNLIVGDIVVYLPPNYASPSTFEKKKSTGTHTMIVSEILEKSPQTVMIRIIDSSFQAHHDNDSRHTHGIKSGIGEATLRIEERDKCGSYSMRWGYQSKVSVKNIFAGRLSKKS